VGEADARAVLAAAGLDDGGRLERAGAGRRNEVWVTDEVVVRLLGDPLRLAMEVALLGRVAAAGTVPVAEVVWARPDPPAAMVQRRLPGHRLADVADAPDELRADVVRVLRAIHDVDVTAGGAGNLGPDLAGEEPTFGAWFVDRVRAEAGAASLTAHERRLAERALGVLDRARPRLDGQPSGLVHGDFQPTNLLVDGRRVTGVLDWEAAKAGPPWLDLGWWDWWRAVVGAPWPLAPHGERGDLRRLVRLRIELRELLQGRGGDGGRLARLLDEAA
jgi:aminoglycoside phosphotransferase (APT) family kinase protein